MSTSLDHYLEAERLLSLARQLPRAHMAEEALLLRGAQAHATLALAGATALRTSDGLPLEDYDAWFHAVSVAAPIPPEPDDGQDTEPEDATTRVGSVSPTEPDELRSWLLALPHRAILHGIDGYPYQRSTGYQSVYGGPDQEYPALVALGGDPKELTEGNYDVLDLAENVAPFTVLALGPEA